MDKSIIFFDYAKFFFVKAKFLVLLNPNFLGECYFSLRTNGNRLFDSGDGCF